MPRRPVGHVWDLGDDLLTVVPDLRVAGKWLLRVRRRSTGGRRQQQFSSEAEACREAELEIAAQQRGTAPLETVAEFAAAYEREKVTMNAARRRGTARNVAYRLKRIIAAFGHRRADSLTRREILEWLHDMQHAHGGPYAATTAYATYNILRGLYVYAAATTDVPNPFVGMPRLARAPRERPDDPWTPRDLRLILDAARVVWAREPQYLLGLWIWMQSGMRAGEIRALRADALDPATGTIRIAETQSSGALGLLKTPRKVAPYFILPTLMDGEEWRPGAGDSWRVLEWYEQLPVRVLRTGFLCGATPEEPWTESQMHRGYQAVIDKTGLPYREPEIFRHTMATLMLSRNAPTALVQNQGAWTSLRIVEQIYARYMRPAVAALPRPAARPAPAAEVVEMRLANEKQIRQTPGRKRARS